MTAATPILELNKVSLRFGGVRAMTDVSCQINKGELFSIIGPNGAGKTSTLNCISGRYRPTSGALDPFYAHPRLAGYYLYYRQRRDASRALRDLSEHLRQWRQANRTQNEAPAHLALRWT